MENKELQLFNFTLRLADDCLILGQRLGEWCGHGPILEQDIAMTNISLDLIGQSRALYTKAAEIEANGRTEDDFAYLRSDREFFNLLLVEQENGNFADTVVRQFFFSVYYFNLLKELQNSTDQFLVDFASKSIKEVAYHVRWSSEWVIRLGDGTEESKTKAQEAIDFFYRYTNEMFVSDDVISSLEKENILPSFETLKSNWKNTVDEVLNEATLTLPELKWFQKGGRQGVHTELLGFLLAEMQSLVRSMPGCEW